MTSTTLLGLPLELRHEIYYHMTPQAEKLIFDGRFISDRRREPTSLLYPKMVLTRPHGYLSLLRTCRQLYQEFGLHLYGRGELQLLNFKFWHGYGFLPTPHETALRGLSAWSMGPGSFLTRVLWQSVLSHRSETIENLKQGMGQLGDVKAFPALRHVKVQFTLYKAETLPSQDEAWVQALLLLKRQPPIHLTIAITLGALVKFGYFHSRSKLMDEWSRISKWLEEQVAGIEDTVTR